MSKILLPNERKNAVQWYLRGDDGFPTSGNKSILNYLLQIEKHLFEQMQGAMGLDPVLYTSTLHSKLEVAMLTEAWKKWSPRELLGMSTIELLALNNEHISFENLIPPEEVKQPLPEIKDALGLKELRHAILCSKCKNPKYGVKEETAQIRASDEGITALYTCRNPLCRFSWRSG